VAAGAEQGEDVRVVRNSEKPFDCSATNGLTYSDSA
jgi:hypothetical protein